MNDHLIDEQRGSILLSTDRARIDVSAMLDDARSTPAAQLHRRSEE